MENILFGGMLRVPPKDSIGPITGALQLQTTPTKANQIQDDWCTSVVNMLCEGKQITLSNLKFDAYNFRNPKEIKARSYDACMSVCSIAKERIALRKNDTPSRKRKHTSSVFVKRKKSNARRKLHSKAKEKDDEEGDNEEQEHKEKDEEQGGDEEQGHNEKDV